MTTTADARREQARGNGVGQAGQFGHQAHSAPAAFDPGTPAPVEVPASVSAWADALAEKLRADKSSDWSEELTQLDAARAEEGTRQGKWRLAAEALNTLVRDEPVDAYKLNEKLQTSIRKAKYPRLQYRPADPEDEDSVAAFIDPYNGQETAIVIEDTAVGHHTFEDAEDVDIDDPDGPSFSVDYDHEGEFESFVYKSGATGKPVRLPEGWRER